ncbi:DUF4430 domain-containing protein [Wukongibacter baidiensis]|uniref:DUF4430 domain-containing protein n=1 Tax=Wukongibacter baidiensis TaxID=1723361 RepID=UPI003D7FCB70
MKKLLFPLLIICIFTLVGCSEETVLENAKVNVIISKNFGDEELTSKEISVLEESSVMEVMEGNFDIETAYGGGFINGIDGLKSGFTGVKDKKKVDWFYYVNGIVAEVGANEYYLGPNDLVIWDYHDWSKSIYLSSIIGAYPLNFINGHGEGNLKTEILISQDYEKEGNGLFEFLKAEGLESIETKGLKEEELENGEINSIVIGTWNEISQFDYIKDVYENGKKAGLFFKLGENITALDAKGEISNVYEKGAVITSITKEYGLNGTLWLITGNDEASIKRATRLLYEEPEKIKGKFSVIVADDDVISIPTKK